MKGRGFAGRFGILAAAVLYFGFGFAGTIAAQMESKPASIPRPPMGWSSWNSFSNTVDAQIVMDQARGMISSGLYKAGYEYVNIDEGWWLGSRDTQGNIVVDPKAWPALVPGQHAGDMSNIVRFIHKLGLKAGIYTDAGKDGCSMYPDFGPKYFHTGSEDHYQQDFLQFARWGFDYVKVDWCVLLLIAGTEGPLTRYEPSTAGEKAAGSRTGSANVESVLKDHPISFVNVHAPGSIARVRIAYSNPSPEPRYVELRVNGKLPTRIAFPSTANNREGHVWIQSTLESGDSANDLTFSTDCEPGPVIHSIAVQ